MTVRESPTRRASSRPAIARRLLARPNLVLGAALVFVLLATAALSLVWTPYSATELDIPNRLHPPSAQHWFGTDSLGRDTLSLLIAGTRNAIAVGVIAVGIGLVFGVALGLVAAARRGAVDELVMRFTDFAFAFPALLTAIMLTAIHGPGLGTSIVAIGLFNVPVFARITRAAAASVWSRDFVLAARACGKGPWRITREHVLPNVISMLVVQATIQFATAILAEAALSYLGLGTQPPSPSWGRMLNEAQTMMYQSWWLPLWPGLATMLAVLGLNLLGDGLRDVLDPRFATRRLA